MWPWSSTVDSSHTQNVTATAVVPNYHRVPQPPKGDARFQEEAAAIITALGGKFALLPPHLLALSAFTLGSASTAASVYAYVRFFRRFPTAEWVTPSVLAKKRWVKGYVTRYVLS